MGEGGAKNVIFASDFRWRISGMNLSDKKRVGDFPHSVILET